MNIIPTIFLAFANDQEDKNKYLRELPKELREIRAALEQAESQGLCNIIERANVTLTEISKVFHTHPSEIAIFHYGGHANSYKLLLEDENQSNVQIDGKAFGQFLARQKGLQLVFFNACSTQLQAIELIDAGVPLVIGTTQAIKDNAARQLAVEFYKNIGRGLSIEKSWRDASDFSISNFGGKPRGLRLDAIQGRFPWHLMFKNGSEEVKRWNLPAAASNPLFGLPEPVDFYLPDIPYKYLEYYSKKDTAIYFGRESEIRKIYLYLADAKTAPLLLLSGESGIGKSSLLQAGLIPRLATEFDVHYLRRKPILTPTNEIFELVGATSLTNVQLKWLQYEKTTKKPLVIILDQIEEIFTYPNNLVENEFEQLVEVIQRIFAPHEGQPQGKIVLSFRKEYHLDIEQIIKNYQLPNAAIFIQRLQKQQIIHIVKGLTSTKRHRDKYRLEVEDDLPLLIARDLVREASLSIAPVLQIIMTKLWELEQDKDNRIFTTNKYLQLKEKGILLSDFVEQQFAEISQTKLEEQEKIESSGLILSILNTHTTPYGTAKSSSLEELQIIYHHKIPILKDVLEILQSKRLLLKTKDQATVYYRLIHDTLAPIIKQQYRYSDKPGPRAKRILDSKMRTYNDISTLTLDENDLKLVELGKDGMRTQTEEEKVLITNSQNKQQALKAERVQNKRNRKIGLATITVLTSIAAITLFFFYLFANEQSKLNSLVAKAREEVRTHPNKALVTIQEAIEIAPDAANNVLQTRHDIYSNNEFYHAAYSFDGVIRSVDVSPDGKYTALAINDRLVLLDTTGKVLLHKPQDDIVQTVQFSPDSQYILTGGRDKVMKLYSLSGDLLEQYPHTGEISAIKFSPNSKHILTASGDKSALLWNIDGTIKDTLEHNRKLSTVAFSMTGDSLLTGGEDGKVILWSLEGKQLMTYEHDSKVLDIAFSPINCQIAVATRSGKAYIWNIDEAEQAIVALKRHTARINDIEYTNDGKYILTASNDYTIILCNEQGDFITSYKGHEDFVLSLAINESSNTLVSVSKNGRLHKWKIASKVVSRFGPHAEEVATLDISKDGSWIMTGTGSGLQTAGNQMNDKVNQKFGCKKQKQKSFLDAIRLKPKQTYLSSLDGTRKINFKPFQAQTIAAIAISPDASSYLVQYDDKKVIIYDNRGEVVKQIVPQNGQLISSTFIENNDVLLVNKTKHTLTMQNQNEDILNTLDFTKPIEKIHYDVPNSLCLVSHKDSTISVINTKRADTLSLDLGQAVASFAVSPNGNMILVGGTTKAKLWTEDEVRSFDINDADAASTTGAEKIMAVAFSSDSQMIGVATIGGLVKIFNLEGQELYTIRPFERQSVFCIQFLPSNEGIIIGYEDGWAHLVQFNKMLNLPAFHKIVLK